MTQYARTMTVGAALLTLVAAGATSAQATTSPTTHRDCGTESTYSVTYVKDDRIGMVPPASAPGGHNLSLTLTAGASVTGTITGSAQFEQRIIIARAKETVSVSIAGTLTASIAYSDSWRVPTSWRKGFLHAGADRKVTNWEFGHYGPNCKWITTRKGVAKLPYHIPAFWHSKG